VIILFTTIFLSILISPAKPSFFSLTPGLPHNRSPPFSWRLLLVLFPLPLSPLFAAAGLPSGCRTRASTLARVLYLRSRVFHSAPFSHVSTYLSETSARPFFDFFWPRLTLRRCWYPRDGVDAYLFQVFCYPYHGCVARTSRELCPFFSALLPADSPRFLYDGAAVSLSLPHVLLGLDDRPHMRRLLYHYPFSRQCLQSFIMIHG